MQEIEAKILEVDPDVVEERMEMLDAEKRYEGEVHSTFYDFPDRRIGEAGGVLRLRERGDYAFLTYKEPVSQDGVKVMEETEFDVSDADEADQLLTGLGFERVGERPKHRTAWRTGDALYVLDRHEGVPPLLEVEAPSREDVEAAFEAAGYDPAEMVSWDAAQVVEHYRES